MNPERAASVLSALAPVAPACDDDMGMTTTPATTAATTG